MATGYMTRVIGHLRKAALRHDGGGLTDGQLLECFLARRDESAFEALVRRHGPMVLAVCRRVLGNAHDAEDAFQATFLVLVRKAASIVPRAMVGNWLYGVAYRTAQKAKAMNARRRWKEGQVQPMARSEMRSDDVWLDLQPLLDRELERLPPKYRSLVVLCDLEGKTRKEAARHLGLAEGTVSSRLARGRVILARGLRRHGLTLPAGLLATLLSQKAVLAGVPAPLVAHTVKAATTVAGGQAAAAGLVSAKVVALTEGILKAMLIAKLKIAAVCLLVCGIACLGVGVLTYQAFAEKPAQSTTADDKSDKKDGKKGDKKQDNSVVYGVVKAVDASKNTITISIKKTSAQTYALAQDAKIYLEEGKREKGSEPSQGKLSDLSEGVIVTLKLSADLKAVERVSARGPNHQGVIKTVDTGKNTITISSKPADQTFQLAKDVAINMAFGKKGQESKVSDLREGMNASLNLSIDKKTVRSITVFRPSVAGGVTVLDPGKNTITIATKGKEGSQEKTYELAKDVIVDLPGSNKKAEKGKPTDVTSGLYVVLELSLDSKTVHRIMVHRPSLHGMVKAVASDKKTITITYKDQEGPQEKIFNMAKGIPINVADSPDGKQGKLSDLTEGSSVVADLSLDKQTVLGLTVFGPTSSGIVKGVDSGSNTITITVKEEGSLVDKTLDVAKDAQISVTGKNEKAKLTDLTEGMIAALRLSLDKSKVVAIHAHPKKKE
jgi:RNA polymerase sigma factor (sigma-70 family)